MNWPYIFSVVLLALGFGFVIFWHELGHFLAAKWAGVKVEQFAIGFGTAAIAWRKGIGFRIGSTRAEYERRCKAYLLSQTNDQAASAERIESENDDQRLDLAGRALGIGETEYRLNWLPLGGYVKMLGQDDLNPNALASDPRAYNMKPIGKRMVIVSAGVIMNIILAAIGFALLFRYGFNSPAPVIGSVAPLSPAQLAGLNVGDRILRIDGDPQADFSKIQLSVALLGADEDVRIDYQPAGTDRTSTEFKTTTIRPSSLGTEMKNMLALGIGMPKELIAQDADPKIDTAKLNPPNIVSRSLMLINPGETIVRVKESPIADPIHDFWKLDRALQTSDGKPFEITVRAADGKEDVRTIQPQFERLFGRDDVDFAGMLPRVQVQTLSDGSPAIDKILPDDVILSIARADTGDERQNPTRIKLTEVLDQAGKQGKAVTITVQRDGKSKVLEPIVPSLTVEKKEGRMGLGIGLVNDEANAVVGGVIESSAAARAGIPDGSLLVSVDGKPVANWREVHTALKAAAPEKPIAIVAKNAAGEHAFELRLNETDLGRLKNYRYAFPAADIGALKEYNELRHTTNFGEAAKWGAMETRDLIAQFYLTLKRMIQRTVPASNLMGPVGIVRFGSRLAYKGHDYLLWFLSMISANLAVVNFLPIPIVDGGLFLFLIIEKLQGKPLSARAQSIAQVAGLALIASVFIFVTYQDIMR